MPTLRTSIDERLLYATQPSCSDFALRVTDILGSNHQFRMSEIRWNPQLFIGIQQRQIDDIVRPERLSAALLSTPTATDIHVRSAHAMHLGFREWRINELRFKFGELV